ncbi:interferon-induced protein 44-like isoform X2 [Girardinichthys multiradiatus]|nr:interferon-induced protein 44-like isoform X2 [Girardinichthys multiradiatus]
MSLVKLTLSNLFIYLLLIKTVLNNQAGILTWLASYLLTVSQNILMKLSSYFLFVFPESALDEPWRELRWLDKQKDLQYVQQYQPQKEGITYLRVLLYGPVGPGKSSFINSASNVFQEQMTIPAFADATASKKSFTRVYETHKFSKGRGSSKTFFPVVFNEIMGLEEGEDRGVYADDIKMALEGHVMEGYTFNPASPLIKNNIGYNRTPSADDRVHVLVCVVSANASEINPSVLKKMKSIRETATNLRIPQIAIMTHIDDACGEIQKDLKNVYKSKYLRKKMKDFSADMGFPLNCIFPVKNYIEEIDLKDDVDFLILSALKKMVDFGDNFIENIC